MLVVMQVQLLKRFPETVIRSKYVYDAICHINQNRSKTDAAETFEKLMKLQHEEHGWFVKARLKGEDNPPYRPFLDEIADRTVE